MNKQRRKTLKEIRDRLQACYEDLDMVFEEEQEAYDNLPDSLQESERGEEMSGNVDFLEELRDSISDICDEIDELIE